jgi:membrane protease subunit HflK
MLLLLLAAVYAASGLYIVKGNEQGVVRRFGRFTPHLVASGLHYDWPWPFARVDRVNVNQTRTLAVGWGSTDDAEPTLLAADNPSRRGEFLTGDKNILHLLLHVHYRIANPQAYLTAAASPEEQLRLLAERETTAAVAASGVDFLHPAGVNALRDVLTRRLSDAVHRGHFGLEVEDVTVSELQPPARVKRAFLEVANARAEKERLISEAHADAERRVAQARAESGRLLDRAESEHRQAVESARGAAERFSALAAELPAPDAKNSTDRRRAFRRFYWQALEEILPKLSRQVFVEGQKAVDFTIGPER